MDIFDQPNVKTFPSAPRAPQRVDALARLRRRLAGGDNVVVLNTGLLATQRRQLEAIEAQLKNIGLGEEARAALEKMCSRLREAMAPPSEAPSDSAKVIDRIREAIAAAGGLTVDEFLKGRQSESDKPV